MRNSMNRKLRMGTMAAAATFGLAAAAWFARPAPSAVAAVTDTRSVLTVSVVQPQLQDWPQTVQASGPISAWQEIVVSPETGGYRIAELLVDVGATVRRGQVLARLADESLRADVRKQEAAVAQARANLEQAASNVQRAKSIEGSGALSAQKVEEYRITEATARASLDSAQAELDSTRLKLAQTRIVAADDGLVSSKSGVLGNVVNAGTELYRLVRQGKLEWRPELDALQLARVRAGQPARVTLPSGEVLQGSVRLVGPTLSSTTGRATVYVSLPAGSAARTGMFANGTLELGTKPALTLPQSAVVMRDGRAYVYAIVANDKAASQAVTLGRRQGERVEVVSAVDAHSRVVASGGAFLADGAQVTVAATQTAAGSTR